jgi:CRISPR-associated Csx2 family protein
MARKILVSFLGLGKYEKTNYYFNSEKKDFVETCFIQEAILRHLIFDKEEKVEPILFITNEAYINWNNNSFNDGLKDAIVNINQSFIECDFIIPSGKTEDEIWTIFKLVFDQIKDGDEVYFDITHGFRSLPMLAMVLINYAKFLKNVKVLGVFYGAFDARERVDDFTYTPVWDLKSFSAIQDWTNAANQFLTTGNGFMLSDLVDVNESPKLKNAIAQFTKEILVNRGPDIFSGSTQLTIKKELNEANPENNKPLGIILSKVKSHFDEYQESTIENGLNAVKWCIDNGLIQQGATLLEEFSTTYILIKLGYKELLQDSEVRSIVSAGIIVSEHEFRFKETKEAESFMDEIKKDKFLRLVRIELEIVPRIYALNNYKEIKKLVNDLKNSVRNDVNHAGFREKPRTYDDLKASLLKRYNQFLKLI